MADSMGECLLGHDSDEIRKDAADARNGGKSWDEIPRWSKIGNDTKVSGPVSDILDQWVQQGGSQAITLEERKRITEAVWREGERAPSELHRGMAINKPTEEVLKDFKVGTHFDMTASSFSEELDSALPYADSALDAGIPNAPDSSVIFHLNGNGRLKGLNVQDRAWEAAGFSEQEWIMAGRMWIRRVAIDEEGRVEVWLSNVLY